MIRRLAAMEVASAMKRIRKLLSPLLVLGAFGTLAAMFVPMLWTFWTFDHIEQRARRRVTGAQLQQWAINLIGVYPPYFQERADVMGTNFPQPLLGLWRLEPLVFTFPATTNEDTLLRQSQWVNPGYVRITWGAGMMGHCGFEVGPTNFVKASPYAHKWQDGVYFSPRL